MDAKIRFERNTGISLHRQARQYLQELIRNERFGKDQPLPTEEHLSEQLSLSRGTVRRALADLVQQGVLCRIPGKGTFLQEKPAVHRLAVLFPRADLENEAAGSAGNTYGSFVFNGLQTESSRNDYSLIMMDLSENSIRHIAATHEATGIVVLIPGTKDEKYLDLLLKKAIPFVVLGARVRRDDILSVACDNAEGIRQAIDYLYSLGHREIASINVSRERYDTLDRIQGFEDSCRRKRLTRCQCILLPEGRDTRGSLEEVFLRWARDKSFPTAIISGGWLVTLDVMSLLRKLGKKIPDDFSFVSFDDFPMSFSFDSPLTAIRQPLGEMAKLAVRLLIDNIRDSGRTKPTRQMLVPKLIIRSSCVPIVSTRT